MPFLSQATGMIHNGRNNAAVQGDTVPGPQRALLQLGKPGPEDHDHRSMGHMLFRRHLLLYAYKALKNH